MSYKVNLLNIEHPVQTVDLHVAGEPMRLAFAGLPEIAGDTINDKRLDVSRRFDDLRGLLSREPRGHRHMFAGIVTPPCHEGCDFGIIFMDARRYPYMCGHGIMAAVTAFIEMGWLAAPVGDVPVAVDTPAGLVQATAKVSRTSQGKIRVQSVVVRMESAFVLFTDQPLAVPEYGKVVVDIVFAGGFFAMVSVDQIGLVLTLKHLSELARLGMASIQAGNEQLQVVHPIRPYIQTIDVVEFYDPKGHAHLRGKNVVILGEGQVDRSPCGTGTAAKMALLHHRSQIRPGQPFINEGPSGVTFEGMIVEETTVADRPAIVPEIRGSAYITGVHWFVRRSDDPFPEGFLV
jgi:proline racemase